MGRNQWAAGWVAAMVMLSGCASMQPRRSGLVEAPLRCEDQSVEIYFEPQSAEVTAEGRAVIERAAAAAKGCKVKRVEVLGLADAPGTAAGNLELSKKRARAVSGSLAAAGLPAAEFQVAAAGAAGALTAQGAAQPLRRRVDVILHLTPGR